MSATFETVAGIISETCDIPRDTIKPESHAIDDLGIDSLDFLDIAFAIDKAFGIKMPLEKWTQEVNDGKATETARFLRSSAVKRSKVWITESGGVYSRKASSERSNPFLAQRRKASDDAARERYQYDATRFLHTIAKRYASRIQRALAASIFAVNDGGKWCCT